MENLISKELLSEVLFDGKYKLEIDEIVADGTIILVRDEEELEINEFINIYELAHKCKEWALNQGYILESLINRSCVMGSNYEYFASVKIHKETNSMVVHNIHENTEIEAVIKACQWILDNRQSK